MKSCSLTDGLIAAANKNRIIDTLIHPAIVLHNEWCDTSTGPHHQIGLDFRSDTSTADGQASLEASQVINRLFPEYVPV